MSLIVYCIGIFFIGSIVYIFKKNESSIRKNNKKKTNKKIY